MDGRAGSKQDYDFGIPPQSMLAAVKDVATQIDAVGSLKPEEVARRLGRSARGYGDYQSFGDLIIAFESAAAPVRDYRRELDLQRAVARVSYEQAGVRYRREYFASYPDGVIVVHLSADAPGRISFRTKLALPDNRSVVTSASAGRAE